MKARLPIVIWVVSLALFVVSHLLISRFLPNPVAIHFDMGGRPNGWMSHSFYIISFLCLGTGVSAFLIGICWAIRFFPPSTLNVPNKEYWRSAEHYPEACDFLFQYAFWMAAMFLIFFGFSDFLILQANRAAPPRLDGKIPLVLISIFLGGIFIWSISLYRRFKKVPPQP